MIKHNKFKIKKIMELKNYNVYFFFAILIGITFLVFFVLKPFIIPFIMAIILTHLFGSVYRMFLKITKQNEIISSALTCLCIALMILIPIIAVSVLVVSEAQDIVIYFSNDASAGKMIIESIKEGISAIPVIGDINLHKFINEDSIVGVVKSVSQNALMLFQGAYHGFSYLMFVLFTMFFSLFYLFIDGDRLTKKIMQVTPLKDSYEKILIEKFNSISRATLKGTTLVAIIQGTMGGTLFWMAGVSSPVFFGVLMTLSSIIPSVGSALIWLPVGIFMLIIGKISAGVAILLVGGLVIGSVDNFIKPKLVGKDTQIHPLLVLFSTLGGISLFGIVGFIVGPIIISLFIALWEIYFLEFKQQLQKFNS
jgi:predicted PurR-regulated permease PerM